ncbi:hypothetical protein VTO42DRAFT_3039 [Malbranchea cinnamomea]
MLDKIEEALDHMEKEGLTESLVLAKAIQKLVQDYIQGKMRAASPLTSTAPNTTTPVRAGSTQVPTYTAVAATTPAPATSAGPKKPMVAITAHNPQGAQVKKEEHWIIYIVPDLPSEYPAYDGGTEVLTTEQAAAEFELQTKVKPLRSRWAKGKPGSPRTALVLAFSPKAAANLPTRISLFGWNRPVIRKPPRT